MLAFLPKTKTGKKATRLIIAFFLFFASMQILVLGGQQGGETLLDNPWLGTFGILMIISGVSAFFVGLFSIIKYRERSILTFLITLLGLFILFFILGEFLSPH